MTLQSVPKKGRHVASRVMDGEAVVFLAGKGEVRILNKVGTAVWENIDSKRSVSDIAKAVCEIYDVPRATAEKDVLEFLDALEKGGMLEA